MHLVEEQTKLMREINSTQSGKQPGKTAATNTTDASTVDKKSSATAPSQSAAGKAAADAQPLDTADAQLYVGGFANEVTERELQDFLQNHAKGKIHSVNIMKDEHGQTSGWEEGGCAVQWELIAFVDFTVTLA